MPFLTADRIDKFWASKILIRFTREQLHAIVESARLSDPRAVDYVTDTLVARQRATARYWFDRVNPLDHFELVAGAAGPALCFDDLMLTYRLEPGAEATQYRVTAYDAGARVLGAPLAIRAGASGHTCTAVGQAGATFRGYTMLRIETTRAGFDQETFVHVAPDPASGTPRVIGIWRP